MIQVHKQFFRINRPLEIAGVNHPMVINKKVRVVFFEKTEMWSAPDLLGPEKFCWHDLRIRVLRKLAVERRAEMIREFTPPRVVDIAPKSATEVFG